MSLSERKGFMPICGIYRKVHIVRGILHDYQDCVREKFATESFSLDDCMELKKDV